VASLEQEIGELLRAKKLSLAIVESATGGLISWMITTVPGSSDYFKGSIISYSNEVKMGLVGVKPETIDKHGAVSPQTAREMAAGGKTALGADVCIADTGIAGPGGETPQKPVGLFYIGLAHGEKALSKKHVFYSDREENRHSAAMAALSWLRDYLAGLK
jgi:nicotinamide-nucleotide amidase